MDELNRRFTKPPTLTPDNSEATPLQRDTLLDFGHLHEFHKAQPREKALFGPASPVPQRPLDPKILDALNPSSETGVLRLRLAFNIVIKGDRWSHFWTADVEKEGQRVGKVVAKVLVEALFPHGPMPHCSLAEGQHIQMIALYPMCSSGLKPKLCIRHIAFRPVPGRDVPYCYAIGTCSLPWGETAPVLLLEDLSELAMMLEEACNWRNDEGEKTVNDIGGLVRRLFEGQRRLQDLDIVEHRSTLTNVLVLRSSKDIDNAYLVFLDFGTTEQRGAHIDALNKEQNRILAMYVFDAEQRDEAWRNADKRFLRSELSLLFANA
ncbi:hypothetical protein JCM11641_004374 [Rhodosporidiobolus odoratus]